MLGNKNSSNRAFCLKGEKYAFDLNKIKEICLTSDGDQTKEMEKIENFENDPESNMMEKVSVISREVKGAGNPQNDTIMYDMIKSFITVIIASELPGGASMDDMDFATAITFNTLLETGIIYKF